MEARPSKSKKYLPPNDLRHKLILKRQEGHSNLPTGPPPDPPFNFLKDPMRDNNVNERTVNDDRNTKNIVRENQNTKSNNYGKQYVRNFNTQRKQFNQENSAHVSNFGNRNSKSGWTNDSHNHNYSRKLAKNLITDEKSDNHAKHSDTLSKEFLNGSMTNIKVEVSAKGERKCVMDDSRTISLKLNDQKGRKNSNRKWNVKNTPNKLRADTKDTKECGKNKDYAANLHNVNTSKQNGIIQKQCNESNKIGTDSINIENTNIGIGIKKQTVENHENDVHTEFEKEENINTDTKENYQTEVIKKECEQLNNTEKKAEEE